VKTNSVSRNHIVKDSDRKRERKVVRLKHENVTKMFRLNTRTSHVNGGFSSSVSFQPIDRLIIIHSLRHKTAHKTYKTYKNR